MPCLVPHHLSPLNQRMLHPVHSPAQLPALELQALSHNSGSHMIGRPAREAVKWPSNLRQQAASAAKAVCMAVVCMAAANVGEVVLDPKAPTMAAVAPTNLVTMVVEVAP